MKREMGEAFQQQLRSAGLSYLMEAHDGISAKIAEDAGFEAIWASGFSISTVLGVRDCNEISWSELIDVVEQIVGSCGIPVIVDGDTGFGNFHTARCVANAAEEVGAAGICYEDKQFPKMNSFVGEGHGLVPVEEFVGKLRACADGKLDPGFTLIARTETLISGGSPEEAVARAQAYHEAGADAVFVHSRRDTFDEVAEVVAQLVPEVPVVIAPTTYAGTPAETFEASGIAAVIWANQSMRAAVAAMRSVCEELRAKSNAGSLATPLSSLNDIFELLSYDELLDDELRYLPPAAGATDGQPASAAS